VRKRARSKHRATHRSRRPRRSDGHAQHGDRAGAQTTRRPPRQAPVPQRRASPLGRHSRRPHSARRAVRGKGRISQGATGVTRRPRRSDRQAQRDGRAGARAGCSHTGAFAGCWHAGRTRTGQIAVGMGVWRMQGSVHEIRVSASSERRPGGRPRSRVVPTAGRGHRGGAPTTRACPPGGRAHREGVPTGPWGSCQPMASLPSLSLMSTSHPSHNL